MLASYELDSAVVGDVVIMRRIRDGRITPTGCEVDFQIVGVARSSKHWFRGEPLNGPTVGTFDLERRNWEFVRRVSGLPGVIETEMERGDSD